MLSIFSLVVFDWCIEALSSITRQLWRLNFSSSSIYFASAFKKSTNNSELIYPEDLAANTLPIEYKAVTKDHEFLKIMLFIICSLPFGTQEKSFFVNRVKDDSSILIRTSKFSIIFDSLMENDCLNNF